MIKEKVFVLIKRINIKIIFNKKLDEIEYVQCSNFKS